MRTMQTDEPCASCGHVIESEPVEERGLGPPERAGVRPIVRRFYHPRCATELIGSMARALGELTSLAGAPHGSPYDRAPSS